MFSFFSCLERDREKEREREAEKMRETKKKGGGGVERARERANEIGRED